MASNVRERRNNQGVAAPQGPRDTFANRSRSWPLPAAIGNRPAVGCHQPPGTSVGEARAGRRTAPRTRWSDNSILKSIKPVRKVAIYNGASRIPVVSRIRRWPGKTRWFGRDGIAFIGGPTPRKRQFAGACIDDILVYTVTNRPGSRPLPRETAQRLAVTPARRLAKPRLAKGLRHENDDSRSPPSSPSSLWGKLIAYTMVQAVYEFE